MWLPNNLAGTIIGKGGASIKAIRDESACRVTIAEPVQAGAERLVTIAKRGIAAGGAARQFATTADRDSAEWKRWRESAEWSKWAQAVAPAVKARRRVIQLLGDKQAARILFERVAPRFVDRPGGYTRILKLATPRLGDAGPRAIIEFVGAEAGGAVPAPRVEKTAAR